MQLTYKQSTLLLILFGTFLRVLLGGSLEFGNDEVYYWLYAKYPDISHFDHPGMVGIFIQFFTVNLAFDSELVIRLASIIPSSISMYIIFLIGSFIKNEKVGFVAVLLYHIHIYGFIIAGTFILPDAPLVLFWLLSFYYFIQVLPHKPEKTSTYKLLLAFFFAGCAVYSKYQAVFLLFGVVLYVVLQRRIWLEKIVFYLGFIFPILAVLLILYWNYQHDFISYKFHNDRVSLFSFSFNKNSFFREIFGQFLYNNPYIVITLIILIIAFIKKKVIVKRELLSLFFYCSFPLIIVTIYLSLFRNTLPHWSGVSYLTLLPVLAVFIEGRNNISKKIFVGIISFSSLLIIAVFVINKGIFLPKSTTTKKEKLGRKDVLLDMYGWEQASNKLTTFFNEENLKNVPIISNNWYPAAHIDYYIARPNNMKVYGLGPLNRIHKYYWINKLYPKLGNEALYITDSRNFKDPKGLFGNEYSKISRLKTIPILRGENIVKYVFVYKISKV